jgi:fumarylacetoacetase
LSTGGLAWWEGDEYVELAALGDVFAGPSMNELLSLGPEGWRQALSAARSHDGPRAQVEEARLRLPFHVADFVDFNSSLEHARNVGRILRPGEEPVRSNWLSMPVGYHGRAGTVTVSGTPVTRPSGHRPEFGPTEKLDVELELAFVVGVPSGLGEPVVVDAFADHVFGLVLLADWSARDIQAWEYQPLGPFLGKSFLTSISAWVTPLSLVEPLRIEAPMQDPAPVPHLDGGHDWGLDIALELEVNGEILSRGNAQTLYWTMPQQLAHVTSNGASVRTGDLMATGTISGSEPGSEGSLLELWGGERFLDDGDEVVLRAGNGLIGEVRGRVQGES